MIRPPCFLWDDPSLMPLFTFWQDLHLCLTDCNHNIPSFNHGIRSDKTPKQDRQQPHLQKDGRAHKIIKLILTLSTWDVQQLLHLTRLELICGFTNLCKGSMFTGQHLQCENMSISPVEYIQHAGLFKNIHTLESRYNKPMHRFESDMPREFCFAPSCRIYDDMQDFPDPDNVVWGLWILSTVWLQIVLSVVEELISKKVRGNKERYKICAHMNTIVPSSLHVRSNVYQTQRTIAAA